MEIVKDPGNDQSLAANHEALLTHMVETYEVSLFRTCYMYLRDKESAEDAVQETFLKAYRALHTFRGDCSEKTWLMRIAVNVCRDMGRSRWIEGTYGVDRSMLSGFCVKQTLFRMEGAKERLYIIEFHHQSGSEYYAVEFSSETKTVDLCAHYVNQVYIPPQPHTEEEISVKVEPVIPDHLVEDAKEALKEGYGLTDNALRFFDTTVIAANDGWEIVFKSNTINPRTVGTYTVFYSRAGNCVEKAEWEFDSIYPHQEKQTYWKDNEIWGPYEMNCFAQLRIAGRTIVNEAGGENHMSFEQQAEYDRLYREAGYSRTQYYHGTPGIRDITFEDALSKAKGAVANKWHISQEELDSCDVIYEFDVSDPDQYVWRIRFLIDNGEKMYTVELDSETGNILKRYVGVGTNG